MLENLTTPRAIPNWAIVSEPFIARVDPVNQSHSAVAAFLKSLPGVTARPEFGTEAYFVGNSRFAALSPRGLVIHLPPSELLTALKAGFAKPFVSVGAMGKSGWVELKTSGIDRVALESLLVASSTAARNSHRRVMPKHPAAARRVRRTAKA